MRSKKTLLIIGPTAVGKSTLLDQALKDYPQLRDIITYTTRAPRTGESEGNPYHFVSDAKFRELLKENFFLEHAVVHGLLYGTPRNQVDEAHETGRIAIMDIDVQGAKKMIQFFPEAVTVFIKPPSEDALRQRFIKRGFTNPDDLKRRLESAEKEMAQARDFQHVIVNDKFTEAYSELSKIIENLLKNQ